MPHAVHELGRGRQSEKELEAYHDETGPFGRMNGQRLVLRSWEHFSHVM